MTDEAALTIELVWEDVDLEELRITARNGIYSGSATVYFGHGDVAALAESLKGFPRSLDQVVVFEGATDYPHAKLTFRCVGNLGSSSVGVNLSEFADLNVTPRFKNEVTVELPFDLAALDEFCGQLRAIGERRREKAVLRGLVS